MIKNGIETKVKGTGYHDHNWRSKPMSAKFKNWYWGKVHTKDISIDYSVMIPKIGNKPFSTLLITDKNGAIM
jgi:predicted secreted hydrolase